MKRHPYLVIDNIRSLKTVVDLSGIPGIWSCIRSKSSQFHAVLENCVKPYVSTQEELTFSATQKT